MCDELVANCGRIREFCLQNESDQNKQLIDDCKRLVGSAKFVVEIADEYKFETLTSNGFTQFLRIAAVYTGQIVGQLKAKNKVEDDFLRLFRLFFFLGDSLANIHNKLKEEKDAFYGTDSSRRHFMIKEQDMSRREIYDGVHCFNDLIPLVCFKYLGFWLPKEQRRAMKLLNFSFAVNYNLPWSLSACWSSRDFDQNLINSYYNANLDHPFEVWHMTENWLVASSMSYLINRNVPVKSETFSVPRQKRFVLDHKGNILDFDRMSKQEIDAYSNDEIEQERVNAPGRRHRNGPDTVQCRLTYITSKEKSAESLKRIRKQTKLDFKHLKYETVRVSPKNRQSNGVFNGNNLKSKSERTGNVEINPARKLIIHIHGSGFMSTGVLCCDMYLKKIANGLGGIPILNVGYSLAVPYPVPINEMLDVYLWALSGGADVEKRLGFQPKKIVLSGDSCGAFYAVALTIIINELNKMLAKSEPNRSAIPLPISIVAAYPTISISNATPSKAMIAFEFLDEAHLCMLMVSVYGANVSTIADFKRIEHRESFQKIVAKNKDKKIGESKKNGNPIKNEDDARPWFQCDYATYVNYADYIDSFYSHPFINPILYEDRLSELKDIALFAFVGREDLLMDDSIELARLWKRAGGSVCLDIFHELMHGFFQISPASPHCTEALEVVYRRYQEACGFI